MQQPLIDIIVPTYNRKSDIETFINEISKQTYTNFKVYIVDDFGDYPLKDIIPKDDKFEYIRLDKNRGQAAARNYALEKSQGDIIVSMDDDAWFYENNNALQLIVEYFNSNSNMGCLMFDIKTPDRPWLSEMNSLNDNQQIGTHITCGCAYKSEVLKKINGFPGFFHSGAEESDITFKILNRGYNIIFGKQIKVFHNYNEDYRTEQWYRQLRHNTTRNDLLLVIMYYPLLYITPYFFGKWLSHIAFTLKKKRDLPISLYYTFISLFTSFRLMPTVIKKRNPMSHKLFKHWLKIRF